MELLRKKQVDSVHHLSRDVTHLQLAKKLSVLDLVAIGVGASIGAGVYILVGTVAREHAGPALTISFLIAGIAAALSAFCYAELACRSPSAGSAYHYTYICIGEGVAWLVGWALTLEYTIGGAAVARGITPNLALFFGGEDKLPAFLACHTIPRLGIVVDPCAAVLVVIVTVLLCFGIKEAQMVVTTVNVGALLFIIKAGGYLGFKTGWTGLEFRAGIFSLSHIGFDSFRYFPFGMNGMFAGSAIVFFSYIGFDSVTSIAEEIKATIFVSIIVAGWGRATHSQVKHPQRDLPLGIAIALTLCCILYMLVSVVVVGLVPYFELDPDTPISSAFSNYGTQWAVYIITTGAVTALFASLLGSILPQPRILMAMARDGLLPSFFSDINENTHIPLKGTIVTGIFAAALAFFMNVSQLAGMVSVGTLLAFTTVAVSVLILRYVPPDEMPLSSSLQESIESVSLKFSSNIMESDSKIFQSPGSCESASRYMHEKGETQLGRPLILKGKKSEQRRRKIAACAITFICVGILVFTSAASAEGLHSTLRLTFCGVGGALLICSLIVLACTPQDDARDSFGHTGGFACPFVPFLPATCVLINTYLLINLGAAPWIRVSIWLALGALVFALYGCKHSSLSNAVYVPSAYANEICLHSSGSLA